MEDDKRFWWITNWLNRLLLHFLHFQDYFLDFFQLNENLEFELKQIPNQIT